MTLNLHLILIIAALVLLALAALKVPELPRLSYGWAGLGVLVLALTLVV